MSPTRFASEHKWLYLGAIVVLLALAVAGLVRYESVKATNEARNKADQLADELDKAGFARPNTDTLVRALGTDGGLVCEDPASALRTALWKLHLSNGATGPGIRPVITDSRAVEAEALVLKVYCPDRLHKIQNRIDDLKTDDTVRRS